MELNPNKKHYKNLVNIYLKKEFTSNPRQTIILYDSKKNKKSIVRSQSHYLTVKVTDFVAASYVLSPA